MSKGIAAGTYGGSGQAPRSGRDRFRESEKEYEGF
jgi:hypothetical protein